MTQTRTLSTRIAHLEALALPLPELRSALDVLNVQRDEVQANILEAERAQQQLDLIGLHVGTVLDGDPVTIEITGGAELPEAHEAGQEVGSLESEATPDLSALETAETSHESVTEPELATEEEAEFVSDAERTRTWALAQSGEFEAAHVSERLDIVLSAAKRYLSALVSARLLDRVDGTGKPGVPSCYVVTAPVTLPAEPPAEPEAEYLPAREARTSDERAVLERMQDGALYSHSHLIHHLQFGRTRIKRATNGLCQAGLIGRRGDLFVVIPQELIGEAAS